MDLSDPEYVNEVEVEATEVEASIDLDRYGLSQNNPTSEAWISLIGTLERFVPIQVGGQDHLDRATVWVDPTEVRSGFLCPTHGKPNFESLIAYRASPYWQDCGQGRTHNGADGGYRVRIQLGGEAVSGVERTSGNLAGR